LFKLKEPCLPLFDWITESLILKSHAPCMQWEVVPIYGCTLCSHQRNQKGGKANMSDIWSLVSVSSISTLDSSIQNNVSISVSYSGLLYSYPSESLCQIALEVQDNSTGSWFAYSPSSIASQSVSCGGEGSAPFDLSFGAQYFIADWFYKITAYSAICGSVGDNYTNCATLNPDSPFNTSIDSEPFLTYSPSPSPGPSPSPAPSPAPNTGSPFMSPSSSQYPTWSPGSYPDWWWNYPNSAPDSWQPTPQPSAYPYNEQPTPAAWATTFSPAALGTVIPQVNNDAQTDTKDAFISIGVLVGVLLGFFALGFCCKKVCVCDDGPDNEDEYGDEEEERRLTMTLKPADAREIQVATMPERAEGTNSQ
jgi:hypothetical protein